MSLHEIVLPETKPETEWICGRARQKMSPTRDHARLQTKLSRAFDDWSEGRGEVGTEWRFRLAPHGEARRPLVPDIAFLSYERMRNLSDRELQTPDIAPDVAIEVLSPDDERRDVDEKIDVYLRCGTGLVAIIDPATRTVELHDKTATRTLTTRDILQHALLPGFSLALDALFASALERPPFTIAP